jgi:excisionase family DNA binding protein
VNHAVAVNVTAWHCWPHDQQHPNGSRSPQGRPLLKPEEVAERLNVSLRFIRRLCHERRMPYTKVGKFVRFDADELEAWIATQRIVPRD